VTKGSKLITKTASFIESMECLPVSKIPEGPEWTYEIKLDGYRLRAGRDLERLEE
jgi:ATP-dependent DNA ligase